RGQETGSGPQADFGRQQWRAVTQQARPSPVDQVREERRAFAGVTQANAPSSSPIDQVRQERREWVPPGDAWRNYQRSAYAPTEASPAVGIAGPAAPAPSPPQSANHPSPVTAPPQSPAAAQPPA